jgi:biopolymer transport protein ExbB/TolQ
VNLLYDTLYLISNAFLLPALLGVLALFAYASVLAGEFLGEWADRRANLRVLGEFYADAPSPERFRRMPWRSWYARFAHASRHLEDFPALAEKEAAEIDHDMQSLVDRLALVARVAPILGLIGTLIPLQPALAGLARGDMQTMGLNLQIGFTTTVLGLISGGVCFVLAVIYRGWNRRAATDFHFLLDIWLSGGTHEKAFSSEEQICREPVHAPDGASGRARSHR